LHLARLGCDVLLLERSRIPRGKVCGEALIADAHKADGQLAIRARHIRGRRGRLAIDGSLDETRCRHRGGGCGRFLDEIPARRRAGQ